ncbi:tetratricopeptide repeat protein 33 isoform X1 [Lingula anatina]|uniref:Tetratricopeptide repeat protein 33 isoform X1 n=1 Tax=Lingula anatina TaxID=7574 RepID=A0A1S3IJX4_LINAN|nr:tetratricopeptide repeat protein 33 isoform X1 [Lingula anatina]|eukprot:XP_013398181.1 tetratricopeptide repeat protein 33 isoform X1 [Lingula anatina]
MVSFGWKKKIDQSVVKRSREEFEKDAKDVVDEDEIIIQNGEVDWLSLAPKRNCTVALEDSLAKAGRLKTEGGTLAEAERYWEALKKWDEALALTPKDATLYEMKAQAYLQLCEVFPAVQSASKAVQLAPTWWEAYQTLGRTHLGLGEVKLALRSFSKAFHINPSDQELWEEDLQWTLSLLRRKQTMKDQLETVVQQSRISIRTVEEESEESASESTALSDTEAESRLVQFTSGSDEKHEGEQKLRRLPGNYVQMRDTG